MIINVQKIEKYFNDHKDEPIQDVYDSIKVKKRKDRTPEEQVIYTYLCMNRKKLGIK